MRTRRITQFWITLAAVATPCAAFATGEMAQPEQRPAVARAVVTHGVEDREPIDEIRSISNDQAMVYFFTELQNLQQTNVIHRWRHEGKAMGDVAFHVGGSRWRVWSTKNLEPNWTGSWSVEVVDAEGSVLDKREFTLVSIQNPTAAKPAEAAAPAAPGSEPEPTP